MKNLLYKEFKLVLHPSTYIFILCSAIVCAPNYPIMVGLIWLFTNVISTFQQASANGDIQFSALLPVKRSDIVLARHILIISVETAYLILSIPFAIIAATFNKNGNLVGIDANPAFYGIELICIAIYNACLLPYYFKTGIKSGMGILRGILFSALFYGIIQTLICIPSLPFKVLDGLEKTDRMYQWLFLLIGLAVFIILSVVSFKKSVKNFEKVSL